MKPKMVRDIMLVDRESGESLTDKLHIFMCSLKEVSTEWSDCRTELEEILFLIKNLDNMDSTSTAYREGRYREFFDAARTNSLTEDEIVTYSQSLDKLRETQAGIRYAAEKAAAKARAEGIAEGMRIMLSLGIPKDIIAQKFGISVEEVSIAVAPEA